jgi:hypothetical protein
MSIGDKHTDYRGHIRQWQSVDLAELPRRGHFFRSCVWGKA